MTPRWELGHNMAQPGPNGPNMAPTWPQHGFNTASTAPKLAQHHLPPPWPVAGCQAEAFK